MTATYQFTAPSARIMCGMESNDEPPTSNPAEVLKRVYGVDRQQWGRWSLDPEHQVLGFDGSPEHPALDYWIPLRTLETQAGAWEWIRQVASKTWCTEEDLGHLVRAVLAIATHQAVLGTSPAQAE